MNSVLLYLTNFAELTSNGLYTQGFRYYLEPVEIMRPRENHGLPTPQAVTPVLHRTMT